jgi:hydrogenase maturation protein HypF
MADNDLTGNVLGVSWDGSGYGTDGTVWGGEFLRVDESRCQRVAHLRTFPLPGNERAVLEPRRSALGLLHEVFGDDLFSMYPVLLPGVFTDEELRVLLRALRMRINSPITSSVGRLFDAVASLTGLCQKASFEGQAATAIEFAANGFMESTCAYDYVIVESETSAAINWEPMVRCIIDDVRNTEEPGKIAARFQHSLVDMIVSVARKVGEEAVVLTGGCFQNRLLTEHTIERLRADKFIPYWHRSLPPNDGGLALGQILGGIRGKQEDRKQCV